MIRYRKKVEKDEAYIASVAALGAEVEDLVRQNNAVDIYEVLRRVAGGPQLGAAVRQDPHGVRDRAD